MNRIKIRRALCLCMILILLSLLLTACGGNKPSGTMDGFTIEGKWKSIGSYGFGQAQPGAIVVFNGTNCNFFSPQDTYAFYQDGNNYKLETTSFMSTDTLSFTVKIIDSDHIDIYRGDNITELERVD